jgi:sugar phosphate isomerase/epimerase
VLTGRLPRPPPGQPFPKPRASAQQLAGLFKDMAGMGWSNMENFAGTWGVSPSVYVRTVAGSGLHAVSSHDDLDRADWNAILDRAVAMHQEYVGSGMFGKPGIDTLDHTLQTAASLEMFGERAAQRGLKFFVHTHQAEIKTHFDVDLNGEGTKSPQSVLDIVSAKTDRRYVNFEIDVGWAAAAFGLDQNELVDFLTRHRNRVVMLHIKDMTAESKPTDLGRGVLDYSRLIQAAGPQVAYYIWEYDHPPKPLASARIAYHYMTCGAGP